MMDLSESQSQHKPLRIPNPAVDEEKVHHGASSISSIARVASPTVSGSRRENPQGVDATTEETKQDMFSRLLGTDKDLHLPVRSNDDHYGEKKRGHQHRGGQQEHQQQEQHSFNYMTPEERQLVLEEIHGVSSCALSESPTFVFEKVQELRNQLQRIRKKPAYDRAAFLHPKYVNGLDFQLMFLRADKFDSKRAAKRIVLFFEHKLELWGERMIARRITSADLSQDDMKALKSGGVQIIHSDQAGRPIIFLALKDSINNSQHDGKAYKNELRAQWYLMMTTVERNERTQRSGVVEVVWNLTPNASPIAGSPPAPPSPPPISAFGPSGEQAQEKRSTSSSKSNDTASQQPLHQQQQEQQQQQVLQRVSHLVHSIPIRIVALHYCVKEGGQQYQDASEEREEQAEVGQQSSATTSSDYDPSFILGHGDSYRFRSHVGPPSECQKQLDTFGIPRILLPVELKNGTIKRGEQLQNTIAESIHRQRLLDNHGVLASNDNISDDAGGASFGDDLILPENAQGDDTLLEDDDDGKIWLPGPYDVLLGRGKPFQQYEGNRLMNQLIEVEVDRCRQGNIRLESNPTVDRVWNTLKARGVRFLKRSETDPEEWTEVHESVGRGKVYFAVRIQVRKRPRGEQDEGGGGVEEEAGATPPRV